MTRRRITVALGVLVGVFALAVAVMFRPPPTPDWTPAQLATVQAAIDKVRARPIRTDSDTPWVVMHAMIAFGTDFTIHDAEQGVDVNGADYLLRTATHKGRRIVEDHSGSPVFLWTKGEYAVEAHPNQFLLAFMIAELPLTTELVSDSGRTYTLRDLLMEGRLAYEQGDELGWTLAAPALAEPDALDESWTTRAGVEVTMADLVQRAIQQDPMNLAEFGTHHLYGLAAVVEAQRARQQTLSGVWKEADDYLARYRLYTHIAQRPDGSLFVPGKEATPNTMVHILGHVLEWWLLSEPVGDVSGRTQAAALRLAEEINAHPIDAFSIGGLYHAAHGLVEFQKRR